VIQVPNPRPPNPHSSRLFIDPARFQRTATKPPTVTIRKKKITTPNSRPCTPPPLAPIS
jgi:hypothetical protein